MVYKSIKYREMKLPKEQQQSCCVHSVATSLNSILCSVTPFRTVSVHCPACMPAPATVAFMTVGSVVTASCRQQHKVNITVLHAPVYYWPHCMRCSWR